MKKTILTLIIFISTITSTCAYDDSGWWVHPQCYQIEAISKQIQRLDSENQETTLMGVPNTWPGRPRLRSLPRLRAIAHSIDEAARRPKQQHRRKPSRAKS